MASINSLPLELLELIITSIPTTSIREDSYAVLLVNKTFYSIAQPHVLRTITLDEAAVRRYPPRYPPFAPEDIYSEPLPILTGIRDNLRELDVNVHGKQLHPNQSCLQVCHPNAYLRIHSHMDRFMEVDRWRRAFNLQLTPLGADLPTFSRLQALTIKMRCPAVCSSAWQPWPRDAEAFLQPQIFCELVKGISLCGQLTTLTIDTADVEVSPFSTGRRYEGPNFGHGVVEEVPKVHVCSAISKMLRSLPRLRSFKLRRRDICPSIFFCEGHSHEGSTPGSEESDSQDISSAVLSSLETLCIDLRLPGIDLCHQSKSCRAVKHCKSWPCSCEPCQAIQQQLEMEDAMQTVLVTNNAMDFLTLQQLGPVEDPARTLTRHLRSALASFIPRFMPNAKDVKLLGFEEPPKQVDDPVGVTSTIVDCLTGKSIPLTAQNGISADDPF